MFRVLGLGVLLCSSLGSALAAPHTCTHNHGSMGTRTVEVQTEAADKSVPCKVAYTKDGTTTFPWNAKSEAGYCDKKAEELVASLKTMGWTCTMTAAATTQATDTAAPSAEPTAPATPATTDATAPQ